MKKINNSKEFMLISVFRYLATANKLSEKKKMTPALLKVGKTMSKSKTTVFCPHFQSFFQTY